VPRQSKQLSSTATDIEPVGRRKWWALSNKEITDHHPLPAMEKIRIRREAIAYRVAKQLRVRRRVTVEFRIHLRFSSLLSQLCPAIAHIFAGDTLKFLAASSLVLRARPGDL
jgi:hypothetical protein